MKIQCISSDKKMRIDDMERVNPQIFKSPKAVVSKLLIISNIILAK